MSDIILAPLTPDDREQFILDNQEAFNYGALEEFGRRDDHFADVCVCCGKPAKTLVYWGKAY